MSKLSLKRPVQDEQLNAVNSTEMDEIHDLPSLNLTAEPNHHLPKSALPPISNARPSSIALSSKYMGDEYKNRLSMSTIADESLNISQDLSLDLCDPILAQPEVQPLMSQPEVQPMISQPEVQPMMSQPEVQSNWLSPTSQYCGPLCTPAICSYVACSGLHR